MGISMGASSLIARRLGAKNREGAAGRLTGAITLFFIVSGITTIICMLGLNFLMQLFGATGEVLTLCRSYMFVETAFQFMNFLLMVLAEIVRAEGNPVLASTSQAVSGIVNCIADPILGFGWGFIPRMGMAGFALATTIGRAIGVAMLLAYILSGKSTYRFKLRYFIPNFKLAYEIYRVGASMTVRLIAGAISQIIAPAPRHLLGHYPSP